jgi:hypothetical protein
MSRIKRFATTAVLTAATGLAALATGAGPANAVPATPNYWCPGQALPFPGLQWDMNVCHTWYAVPFGQGNVQKKYVDGTMSTESDILADAPAPDFTAPEPQPLPPGTPFCSPRGVLVPIGPICDEIGVDIPPGSVR